MKTIVMTVAFTLEVPDNIDEQGLFFSTGFLDAVQFCRAQIRLMPKDKPGRGLDPFLHHISPPAEKVVEGAVLLSHDTVSIQDYNPDEGLPSKTF